MTSAAVVRTLSLPEVEILLDWARNEGWNPGLHDASPFYATDPSGFFGCFVGGTLVAGIAAVRYGQDYGFIGLYICHPEYRGRGFGRMVWDHGMQHLERRTIGLDGVPERQANYRSMGFQSAYRTLRWTGVLPSRQQPKPSAPRGASEDLVAYDALHFPRPRPDFLHVWFQPPRHVLILTDEGRLQGYAVIRRCHDGYKIGPLFADTAAEAEGLLWLCSEHADGAAVHLDVPEGQDSFSERLRSFGMTPGFTTARMYRGPFPKFRQEGVFAITTLELG